jgi:hypothetical protein
MADYFFNREIGMIRRRLRCAAVFVLSGMGLVVLTRLVRPHLVHASRPTAFFFGLLPNFGAAFSLPFFIVVFPKALLRLPAGERSPRIFFAVALAASFLGLVAWEWIQHAVWGYTFDPYDIAATAAGCACAAAAYLLCMKRPTVGEKQEISSGGSVT